MEKKLSTIIILSILIFVLSISPLETDVSRTTSYENSFLESDVIGNLTIKSEEELEEFASVKDLPGNGSEENPFQLENYTIDGMGANHSIYLENIELHFIINDCKIYNSSLTGIKLNQVSNFTLENSVVKNSTSGIDIESSENIIIKGSSISENQRGIYLREGANNNTITNNNISNNVDLGVFILGDHNLIYHNIFFENGDQARDDGDNQWDDGERGGNYWSDYDGGDRGDGIGNESYKVDGNDNEDRYPLIYPIGPPINLRAIPVRDEYIELTWDKPRYSIRYPIEEIIIYRGEAIDNLSVYEKINSTVRDFQDENVTEGETYYYGLRASNKKYVSVMSEISSAEPDTTSPEIEDHYPVRGDENVPINATIKVEFSKEMKEDTIQISVEDHEGRDVEGELYGETMEFFFEPHENLSYETTYQISVNGSDIASNWFDSIYTWSFTTVSDTGMIIGRIVNEEGEPLDNVQIYVDEDHQTYTYPNGEFEIEVPSGNFTLEISREGYEDKEIEFYVNQSEEKDIGDIVLNEQEGIISRWFWPMALAGGGILILGILALIMFFYQWEEEEPLTDEEIYDIDYEDVDAEEFESWWEDEEL